MTSLTTRPGAAGLLSPYDVVAATTTPVPRTKRQLVAASRALEQRALAAGVEQVLVTFQDRRHLTAASRASYGRLAQAGARVHAFARGLTSDYGPASRGLVHVALLPSDPLVGEWDIVVLGPRNACAFLARDLAPTTPVVGKDLDRPFSWVQTEDRDLVQECASRLLARLP